MRHHPTAKARFELTGTTISTPWSTLEVGLRSEPGQPRPGRRKRGVQRTWWICCLNCDAEWATREPNIIQPMKLDGSEPRTFCRRCRDNARELGRELAAVE